MSSLTILLWLCTALSGLAVFALIPGREGFNQFTLFGVILAIVFSPFTLFVAIVWFVLIFCENNFYKINPTVWRRK